MLKRNYKKCYWKWKKRVKWQCGSSSKDYVDHLAHNFKVCYPPFGRSSIWSGNSTVFCLEIKIIYSQYCQSWIWIAWYLGCSNVVCRIRTNPLPPEPWSIIVDHSVLNDILLEINEKMKDLNHIYLSHLSWSIYDYWLLKKFNHYVIF